MLARYLTDKRKQHQIAHQHYNMANNKQKTITV